MNKAIETNDIRPVVGERTFSLEQLKEECQYQVGPSTFEKLGGSEG
jgi:hypothetical protein